MDPHQVGLSSLRHPGALLANLLGADQHGSSGEIKPTKWTNIYARRMKVIEAADLQHAGTLCAAESQHRPEVQVVREHGVVVCNSPLHQDRIWSPRVTHL